MAHKDVKRTARLTVKAGSIVLKRFDGKTIEFKFIRGKGDRRPSRADDRRLAALATNDFDEKMSDLFLQFKEVWLAIHQEISRRTKRGAK